MKALVLLLAAAQLALLAAPAAASGVEWVLPGQLRDCESGPECYIIPIVTSILDDPPGPLTPPHGDPDERTAASELMA